VLAPGLCVLIALGWTTGLIELTTRSGRVAPLQIAAVDIVHIEAGLAALIFLGWLLGTSFRKAPGRRLSTPPQIVAPSWLIWSVATAYLAVAVTGVLVLIPLSTLARDESLDGHLLSAVVSIPVTIGLATVSWTGARRDGAMADESRRGSRPGRVVLGTALALSPLVVGFAAPRAVTPLAEAGAGAAWVPLGRAGYADRIAALPTLDSADGSYQLVVGGAGLDVATISRAEAEAGDGSLSPLSWHKVSGFPPADLVLALLVAPVPATPAERPRIFVGTLSGAYEASNPFGPYRRLLVRAGGVHAFAVDPRRPDVVWATSYAGPERSTDGGAHFTVEAAGMRVPGTSWAISYVGSPGHLDPVLICSDQDAVYAWHGSHWVEVLPMRSVVSLDSEGPNIWSSSMGEGVEAGSIAAGAEGGLTWRAADAGLDDRTSGPILGTHVVSVTGLPGTDVMYAATMLDGVAVSLDNGSTWSGVWEGLRGTGVVSRVLPVGGLLVAATDRGVYGYRLPPAPDASPSWWVLAIALGLVASLLGLFVLVGRDRIGEAVGASDAQGTEDR
jgi:hypothetical protein